MEGTHACGIAPVPDDVGRRASFRVDLYTVDDGWRGHIRHILSREHTIFDVDDGAALMAFIIAHLPQPHRPPARPVPPPDGPDRAPATPCPSLDLTWSLASANGSRTSQLARGEAFEVRYDPVKDPLADRGGWMHGSIELHARRIGGAGSAQIATGLWSPGRAREGGVIRGRCELGAGVHQLRLLVRGVDRKGRTVGVAVSPAEAMIVVI